MYVVFYMLTIYTYFPYAGYTIILHMLTSETQSSMMNLKLKLKQRLNMVTFTDFQE